MRLFVFLVFFILSVLISAFFHLGWGPLPPLGKILDPVNGLWANAETKHHYAEAGFASSRVQAPVVVRYDERLVPHIYAQNEHDLFFAQGFVTARHRLWQMEFTALFASGQLSEVLGERALALDVSQRRKGLGYAAELSQAEFLRDPRTNAVLQAFTDGVNAYIEQLSYRDYPVEYKLLDYAPTPWTPMRSALILKYMADLLTGSDTDVAMTKVYQELGVVTLWEDFPDRIDVDSTAIVPVTKWDSPNFILDTASAPWIPVWPPKVAETHRFSFLPVSDSAAVPSVSSDSMSFSFLPEKKSSFSRPSVPTGPEARGSNNWAVSSRKSATGAPLLANDPHLPLNLPSIWFEMHLHAPDFDCYGVSIPGTPTLIIGFNNRVAWGVTNGTIDVKDWYTVTFKDERREEYLYDQRWLPVTYREERIKVRGREEIIDTVRYTLYGPISYEDTLIAGKRTGLAMRWTGHDPANELLTFYLLNKAKGYEDYREALTYFACPAQNFVYADVAGNIALVQQGRIPLRWPGQGKMVMDGHQPAFQWQGFWDEPWIPQVKNPSRGYVFSANQHPTDGQFPLYYTGWFEPYRHQRIAELLAQPGLFSVEDMQRFQLDEVVIRARTFLPELLLHLSDSVKQLPEARPWLDSLEVWDFRYHAFSSLPTFFETWYEEVMQALLVDYQQKFLLSPQPDALFRKWKKQPHADWVTDGFLKTLDLFTEPAPYYAWWKEKETRLQHMAKIPAFGSEILAVGGNEHALNAITSTHGPSWRMVVSLEKSPHGWGVYPGGQSGNPGSPFYLSHTAIWAKGAYYPLERTAPDAWLARASAGVLTLKPAEP